ncbi:MAG: protoheme IX farnesyltransferase [Chloroflexi bacterium]|nr:protoheme IX farnesyltransferase [Chloroflexota bacterium]
MTALRRVALATAIATYFLIVVGAVVRTTGSGLGCPDWPLCHGQFLPPPQVEAWIEFSHRFSGAVVSALILIMVAAAWVWARHIRHIVWPATAVPFMLAAQIVLGAWVVWLETPSLVVMVHLSFAFIILAFVLWVNIAARVAANGGLALADDGPVLKSEAVARHDLTGYWRLVLATTVVAYLLLLVGGYVRATGAGWVCGSFPNNFPGCNGLALPYGSSPLVDLHLTHRMVAYLLAALVGVIAWKTVRMPALPPSIRRVVFTLVAIVLVQIAIGIIAVVAGPSLVNPAAIVANPSASAAGMRVAAPLWIVQTLHVAGASAVWSMAVVLMSMTWHLRRLGVAGDSSSAHEALAPAVAGGSTRQVISAYFELTKPRVIVLLLITTIAAMLMVHRGLPPLGLIFWTLLGGALAAGGAGAINHYLDRDVDEKMGRTSHRPIPSGTVPPLNGLFFGITLGIISFTSMVMFVNTLSAILTLIALLIYVFVYTRWLKRSTPLNIVIGGAAGAIPPVVGIAAVTGHVDWLAVWLFTIVFVWTPPHFWALSLLMQREYAAAGIPMLPIVRGEAETRKQILWYSLAMVALTIVVWTFGLLGAVYLVSALVLGGLFLYYAIRLCREESIPAARRLFHYSMLYLALLFVAMVVDRQILL